MGTSIMSFIISALMIVCGLVFRKIPPKKINALFGYRTRRSMTNQDTWNYAHKTSGTYWFVAGCVTCAISLVVFLTTYTLSRFHLISGITFGAVLIVFLFVIPYTEIKLKNNFQSKKEG